MDSALLYVLLGVVLLLVLVVGGVALVRRGRTPSVEARPRPGIDYAPGVGDDDSEPRDTPRRTVDVLDVGSTLAAPTEERAAPVELVLPEELETVAPEDLEALAAGMEAQGLAHRLRGTGAQPRPVGTAGAAAAAGGATGPCARPQR